MTIPEHDIDPIPDEDFIERTATDDDGCRGIRFIAFNTVVDVKVYGGISESDDALERVVSRCRTFERLFSRTLPHSDISRINDAGGATVQIDARTYDLLTKAIRYCDRSEGTFDICVGPLIALWDFENGVIPDRARLSDAARHVDWRTLSLRREAADTDHVRFTARMDDPDASIDVGGIAKGWIADELADELEAEGFDGFIVNLGGNVVVRGERPDARPWNIGIRDPRRPSELIGSVPLRHGSAVTSGTYERSFTGADGTLYHHILDPRTGLPVQTDVAGVTLLCDRSIDAEGFSTTLLALGGKRGMELARRLPVIRQAIFVAPDGTVTPAYR